MPSEADTYRRRYVVPLLKSASWDNQRHSMAERIDTMRSEMDCAVAEMIGAMTGTTPTR